jgi:arsenite methyltransferase
MDTHLHPPAPRTDDLLGQAEITASVQQAYRAVIGARTEVAARLYDPEQLAQLPRGAIEQALGVGNPVRAAALRPGEVVLDLGSGGGIDTLLAARAVQPGGEAIGLDILPEMLAVAARNAAAAGLTNVRWLQGQMEAIPLPDESVDVIVSNGVVNLSPRKSRVFAEMFRILRPGGRFSVADIVLDDDLPPQIATDPAAWAG